MLCFSSTVSYNPAFESLTSKSAYVTPVTEDKLIPDPFAQYSEYSSTQKDQLQ